jgi:diguanylate cyclase (GGDEF)-like protein
MPRPFVLLPLGWPPRRLGGARPHRRAPLDRSPGTTIAQGGARVVAALLPLAAVGLLRAVPSLQDPTPPWVSPAVATCAAAAAAIALLVAVTRLLSQGRARDLADLAALGMLGTAFAVVAVRAAGSLGPGIGVVASGAVFAAGSLVGPDASLTRRGRLVGLVLAIVLVEGILVTILLGADWAAPVRTAPILLLAGALLLALGAVTSLEEPARATALGIGTSSAFALAISPSGNEALAGGAGMALAALVLGAQWLAGRGRNEPVAESAPRTELLLEARPEPPGEAEFDELSRITRELRATLDDLVAARHLIELQRIEIERASSTDQLTGLASRSPTLERLRIEAAEARRYAHPLAVVLLDIDRFADLNHEHGIDVGDAILRELALRLRVRVREADAVGRIGADSFVVVLPHADEAGAATFARAVLDRVLGRRVVTDRGEAAVQLSIGIALMRPGMTLTGDELLAAAEEALASAQAAGGNRIAFDRLHGLARLDERGVDAGSTVDAAGENG